VESGLNDGLALPFVLIFIATATNAETHLGDIALELVAGLALGIVIPAVIVLAWRLRILTAEPRLQALGPLAIAVILYAACHLTHANPYLAAFAAGSTIATLDRVAAERFEHFGDLLSETTKFAALLVFGALITPDRISDLSFGDWAVAVIAILLVRPAAMLLSLLRTSLPARERSVAAWFGPKGFASVVYGLLAVQAGIPTGDHVFDLVAITIALSIVLHSSTDVPVAKALRVEPPDNLPTGQPDTPTPDDLSPFMAVLALIPRRWWFVQLPAVIGWAMVWTDNQITAQWLDITGLAVTATSMLVLGTLARRMASETSHSRLGRPG
jgi:NhaP-type Na+/H+ or K+/H+ antiporter